MASKDVGPELLGGPVIVRAMSQADAALSAGGDLARWRALELVGGASNRVELGVVAEQNAQIVGWSRAVRVHLGASVARAWWMAGGQSWETLSRVDRDGDTLLGLGASLLAGVEVDADRIKALYGLGRGRLVRRLGLRRWIACVFLEGYRTWREVYCLQGYVQQVESGAIVDVVLTAHLLAGARVLDVPATKGAEAVWIVWENPVR
ncbi:MAG: hypothetical protein H0U74_19980 [Bradymonadaceae bacterium]|nr:hypothetical protein [Lujinxingiaceae bacterium]